MKYAYFSEHASLHVFQPSGGLTTTPSPKTVGVCVAPQPGVEDTTYSALESILLNRHFGIKHFILYDHGLTSKFFAQLDRAKMNTDLNVSFITFSFLHTLSTSLNISAELCQCHR